MFCASGRSQVSTQPHSRASAYVESLRKHTAQVYNVLFLSNDKHQQYHCHSFCGCGTLMEHVIVFVGNIVFDELRINSDPAPGSVASVASVIAVPLFHTTAGCRLVWDSLVSVPRVTLRLPCLASYRRRAHLRSALRKLNDRKVILSVLNDHVRSSQAQDSNFCGAKKFRKWLLRHYRWWLVGVPHTACFPSSGYAVQCQTLWKLLFFRL